MFKDYYKILEISEKSSSEDIKKAYRKLALRYHPDRNNGNKEFEDIFKKINEAYEVLSNENQKILYDYEYKKYYNLNSSHSSNAKEEKAATNSREVTPSYILELFEDIYRKIKYTRKENVLNESVFRRIQDLLSNDIILFLQRFGDLSTNKKIVQQGIKICDYLIYEYSEKVCVILSKLAGSDDKLINEIYKYSKKRKNKHIIFDQILPTAKWVVPILFLIWVFSYSPSSKSSTNLETNKTNFTPETGNLNQTSQPEVTKSKKESDSLEILNKYADWDSKSYNTGNTPSCYNYKAKYDFDINNKLVIKNTTDRDAVVKLIRKSTNKCIRYVYIRQSEEYTMQNIPLGEYYTKIAYGIDWRQKNENGKCSGRFIYKSIYKNDLKDNAFFEFTKKTESRQDDEGNLREYYRFSSMEFTLFIQHKVGYDFDLSNTSEDDFNDEQ